LTQVILAKGIRNEDYLGSSVMELPFFSHPRLTMAERDTSSKRCHP